MKILNAAINGRSSTVSVDMTVALFATIFNIKRHSPTMNFNTKSALFNEDDVPCCAWAFFAL